MCIFCCTSDICLGFDSSAQNAITIKANSPVATFAQCSPYSRLAHSTEYVINHCPVTPVREEPSHVAEQATQLLFGELCEVLERQSSWTKILKLPA